jgi:chromosome segregation ATPase
LLEELNEVRQQFTIADKARQQVTGLQLALEEYKRILPKIEQDRHELQMMKKQLEFDNVALAQRWEEANEQRARDQESIANLTDKLGDFELERASISVNGEGLDSEIEGVTRKEALLQVASSALTWTRLISLGRRAKFTELETVNQQLQATNTLYASKNTALERLLEDAKERQDERDRKNLENYQEKLMLESSLAAIEQGDPIQGYIVPITKENQTAHEISSTEVFRKMRVQVGMEQKRSAELEAEVSSLKSELQMAEKDRMSSESNYWKMVEIQSNSLSASSGDKKRQTVDEVQKQLIELQNENRSLKKQSRSMKMDLDEQKRLLRNAMDEKAVKQDAGGSDQELMAILQDLKTATVERPNQRIGGSNTGLDNQISLLADKIIDGRERLAKRAEVQHSVLHSKFEPERPAAIAKAAVKPRLRFGTGADFRR